MDITTEHILSHLARSATPVEWLWTLTGLFTLTVCVRILNRFRARKREWLAAGLNGTVLKQVNGNIEVALWNISIQLLASAWGVTLLLTLPANARAPVTPSGIVNGLVIMSIEMIMAIKLTRLDRRYTRIAAEVREREEMGFTGPIPVSGFDAQIGANRRLLEAALAWAEVAQQSEAAAKEVVNASTEATRLLYSSKAQAKKKGQGDEHGDSN